MTEINSKPLRIAIVHDDLTQYGGAERVVKVLHEIWPDAPIYTSIYDRKVMLSRGWDDSGMDIRTSRYQWLPNKAKWANKFYLPIYPLAFEQFDFSEYDVVLSSTTRFAHGVITRPETLHISYCNSPARFLWTYSDYEAAHGGISSWQKIILAPILHWQRVWDQLASERPDYYLANSSTAQARIRKIYRRDSKVIFPPVNVESFVPTENAETEDYYVIVGRIAGHKRYDIAVEAFNQLGENYKLKIIGAGDKREELESMAKDNVEFLGFVSDEERSHLVQSAKAFLYPQLEDFGITALEANAAGIPVIAFGKGGVLDTVIDGKTGLFFQEQTVEALTDAVIKFEKMDFNKQDCIDNARRFRKEVFKEKLEKFVEEKWEEYRQQIAARKITDRKSQFPNKLQ